MSKYLDIVKQVLELEADCIRALIDKIDGETEKAIEIMFNCKGKVVVTGMGKGGIIGRKISATFASIGTSSTTVHPAEAIHGDLGMITKNDVVLAISNSGETDELVRLLPIIKKIGSKLIALTGNLDSNLAKQSDVVINTSVEREACPYNLAPTASTTAQLAMGDALGMALLARREFKPEDYALLHPGGSLGKRLLKVKDIMRKGKRLVKVLPETKLRDVVVKMTETRNGAACVVDSNDDIIGFLSDGDFRRAIINDSKAIEQVVGKVMIKNPMTINENKLAVEAASIMRGGKNKFSQLPVLDNAGKLIGLIDDDELLGL